jgi:hypothetical protein
MLKSFASAIVLMVQSARFPGKKEVRFRLVIGLTWIMKNFSRLQTMCARTRSKI